ncbi:hypothetical protein MJO47_14720 [Desulfuromonas sp. KJ2020]|uniref:hypothetical protein n=1 Tax=Desulfuromonas sp. KJ2020 TaxID=2919173 RepID=UPI0020A82676|nr:hypothetical protein [Desulfuromonas sp. KJ2020]MCP3178356.1 hypothetical protein [Desulfuromonas sp. KJ2020]
MAKPLSPNSVIVKPLTRHIPEILARAKLPGTIEFRAKNIPSFLLPWDTMPFQFLTGPQKISQKVFYRDNFGREPPPHYFVRAQNGLRCRKEPYPHGLGKTQGITSISFDFSQRKVAVIHTGDSASIL